MVEDNAREASQVKQKQLKLGPRVRVRCPDGESPCGEIVDALLINGWPFYDVKLLEAWHRYPVGEVLTVSEDGLEEV